VLTKRPQIEQILQEPIGRMYACGHFGCVFQSNDPWSVKLTIDPDEGDIWAGLLQFQIEADYGTDGIAKVREVVRLKPDVQWRGRKRALHAIVREEIYPVWEGQNLDRLSAATLDHLGIAGLEPPRGFTRWSFEAIRRRDTRDHPDLPPRVRGNLQEFYSLLMALLKYREAAEKWHHGATLKREYNRKRLQDQAWDEMTAAMNGMSGAIGGYMGETLASLMSHDIILRDVHWNNIAWRAHDRIEGEELPLTLIIFDPGASPTKERHIREQLLKNDLASPFEGEDILPGGMAAAHGITERDVDPDELRMGIEEEMEHTSDPIVAKRIALDHLAEDRDYYSKLEAAGL
jgi:hypothetical protein